MAPLYFVCFPGARPRRGGGGADIGAGIFGLAARQPAGWRVRSGQKVVLWTTFNFLSTVVLYSTNRRKTYS